MDALISVIIPVYNAQNTINRCIQSIIAQTWKNWELIIINDGSQDQSEDIINSFLLDRRIKYIRTKNNGVSNARNIGLKMATGSYITFVDSDDYVTPNYLSNFVQCGLKTFQIIFQGINYVYEGDKPDMPIRPYQDSVLEYGITFGKLYSHDLLKDIFFDINLSLHEDHIFYFDALSKALHLNFSDSIGYFYTHRQQASTLSRKMQTSSQYFYSSELFLSKYDLLIKHFPDLPSKNIQNSIQQFGLNQCIMGIFALYYESISCSKRRGIITNKLHLRKLFKEYYYSKSLFGKMFYLMFMNLPVFLQDMIYASICFMIGRKLRNHLNLNH